MMKMIPFEQINFLLELGGGTGAVTRSLIRKKRKETRLAVFEPDKEFARVLTKKFSRETNVEIVQEKADELHASLQSLNLPSPDCIVSSLPFAALGEKTTAKIFREISTVLPDEGLFLLYQYTLFTLPLILKNFKIKKFTFVAWNIPPALIFLCAKQSP